MIKKIGVENFRVFKDYTEFEIKPITLLTGPNNSGKSSLIKLLLLLKNGLNHLDFKSGDHNLESFDKILNWEIGKKELLIKLPLEDFMFKGFSIIYTYEKSLVQKIIISKADKVLLEFQIDIPNSKPKDFEFLKPENVNNLCINILFFIDLIYSQKLLILNSERKLVELQKIPLTDTNIFLHDSLESEEKDDEFFTDTDDLDNFFEENLLIPPNALKNEILRLEKNYLLFEVFSENQNITKSIEQELKDYQKEIFENLNFHYSIMNERRHGRLNLLNQCLKKVLKQVKEEMLLKIQEQFTGQEVVIKENILCQIMFNSYSELEENSVHIILDLINLFNGNRHFNSNYFFTDKIEFISASRGSQKRVLHNSSENDIDQIVLEYSQKEKKNEEYLEEVLKILEIEGELVIERHENFISTVYIQSQKQKISLADLGYGYSQIIPIALKICNMIPDEGPLNIDNVSNEKVLIIEEPEANLHPNLQAKLGDIFLLTLKFFPHLKFIIETHSEYLIRKLQFLTAKDQLPTSDSIIYYFNADKFVTSKEPKVKKIEITETGNLTDSFGPGFFDEVTQLQFDLMKVNMEQRN